MTIRAFLFDIGHVLIDWDPEYLLRKILPNDAAIKRFRDEVLTQDSILAMDRGQSWDFQLEACARNNPEHLRTLEQYRDRWIETLGEPIQAVVDLKAALLDLRYPVYALSNYGTENMAWSQQKHPFLAAFDGRVISGHVGMIKPELGIYRHTIDRFSLVPEETLFIDNMAYNTSAAAELGFKTHTFVDPNDLLSEIKTIMG